MSKKVKDLLVALKKKNLQKMIDDIISELDQLRSTETELRSDLEELDKILNKFS